MAKDERSYPMLSKANWWKLRDQFRRTLPAAVTPTYLVSLLSLKDDRSAINNVMVPMRALGLIDEEGVPTDLANDWRMDDTYEQACEEMLDRVYPVELRDLLPDKQIDKKIAISWFMKNGVGEPTAKKMVVTFSLLKEADLSKKAESDSRQKPSKSKQNPTKNLPASPKKSTGTSAAIDASPTPILKTEATGAIQSKPDIHIDLQIHISPDSSPEQIEAIFSSMAKHLYRVDGK